MGTSPDVDPRTVGVEEELLVVDPRTRLVTSRAQEVLRSDEAHLRPDEADDALGQELFRHQLETRTDPTTDVGDAVEQVLAGRRRAIAAAEARGLGVVVSGTAPDGPVEPDVSPDDRYRAIVETYGQVARLGTTCGMHVHVAIATPEEGVRCLDRIAPWLPVLLAVSPNSPYASGADTGYASWRTVQWSAWPSAGPTEAFGSVAGYRRACDRLVSSGAARDTGMLYLDARLSEDQPTLEVRVLDAVTEPEDVGLLVALVRALVATAAQEGSEHTEKWRAEELRAARWRAARHGLTERLLHPVTHEPAPARDVLAALVDTTCAQLAAAGDEERVEIGVERVLAGTGAARQRSAYEASGTVAAVVDDLLDRTARSVSVLPPRGERA